MRPETELIVKLVGKLIETVTPAAVTNTTKGSLPTDVRKKIASYDLLTRSADTDLVAMLAMADLLWERRVRQFAGKDENALSNHYQVNLFSAEATEDAIAQMQTNLRDLQAIATQCEAMKAVGKVVVGRSAMFGPANASQITFDGKVCKRLDERCDRIIDVVGKVAQRHGSLLPHLQQAAAAHQ